MRTRINYLFLSFICSFLFSVSLQSQGQMPSQISKIVNGSVDQGSPAQIVVGIIHRDKIIVQRYGSEGHPVPNIAPEHWIYDIGAISEVFTSSLMVQASYEDKFNLTSRIQDYLPSGVKVPSFDPVSCTEAVDYDGSMILEPIRYCESIPFSVNKCISFCDLATHTSGLPNIPRGTYDFNPIKYIKYHKDPYKSMDKALMYEKLQFAYLNYAPGDIYQHSSWGIALLGQTLAEIYQAPFSTILESSIFQPLNMQSTYSLVPEYNNELYVDGYSKKGDKVTKQHFNAMSPALGLKSSTHDLLIFLKAQINGKNKVGAPYDAMSATHEPLVKIRKKVLGRSIESGYGWLVSPLETDPLSPLVWKNGYTQGFSSFIGFVKSSQTGVVILSNTELQTTDLGFDIMELLHESFL